jgi:DNA-directed RNA polymerase specialized sigma24 family protein
MEKALNIRNDSARFSELQKAWHSWLRVRHPSLAAFHADLVQEAFKDLLEWSGRKLEFHTYQEIERIGFRILQRRVIDVFREQSALATKAIGNNPDEVVETSSTFSGSNPEEVADYRLLLRAILMALSELSPSERELILSKDYGRLQVSNRTLSTSERKRLSRLRNRVRRILSDRYGIELKINQ